MVPVTNHKTVENCEEKSFPYRSIIGKLLYLSTTTRPDIAFSVSYLASFQSDPQDLHWTLAKCILRYLKSTPNFGLLYTSENKNEIVDCFVDADLAGDKSRKSTTGFLVRMYPAEAEFVAM